MYADLNCIIFIGCLDTFLLDRQVGGKRHTYDYQGYVWWFKMYYIIYKYAAIRTYFSAQSKFCVRVPLWYVSCHNCH